MFLAVIRKFRVPIIVSVILAGLLGAFIYIARMETLPKGLHYGDWDVSGYDFARFEAEWKKRSQQWGKVSVTIQAPAPYGKKAELTRAELGMFHHWEPVERELEKLKSGHWWERLAQRWALRNHTIPEQIRFDEKVLRQTVNATWPEIAASEPRNAERIITPDDRVEYRNEVPAHRVDFSMLQQMLFESAAHQPHSEPLNLPLIILMPEITVEQLKKEKIERKLVEFTTYFRSSAAGRVHNIRSSAQVVHDRLLKPNEIFDYAEVVQETRKKYGFKPAPVIMNGQLVPGVGGGICQVSSTLYNAALLSGLEIVERRHHSLPVHYVPLGLDATYSDGYINFRFRNHEHSHLLIRTETGPTHITVKLFGSLPAGRSYRVETKVLSVVDPPVKYVQNKSLPPGKRQVLRKGKQGYVVETVRIRLENGKEVERERISRDFYRPQPALVAVRNPVRPQLKHPGPPIVEDGVRD